MSCTIPFATATQTTHMERARENLSRLHNPCTYIFHCIVAVPAVVKAHLIIITNEKLFSLEAQYPSLRGVSLRFARYMRSKNHAYRYIYCRTAFAPRIRSSTSSSRSLDHVALSSDGCNAPTTRSLARSLAKSNRKCRSDVDNLELALLWGSVMAFYCGYRRLVATCNVARVGLGSTS